MYEKSLMEGQKARSSSTKRDCLTFNLRRRPIVSIEDWSLPGNVKVGLDSHDCGWSVKVSCGWRSESRDLWKRSSGKDGFWDWGANEGHCSHVISWWGDFLDGFPVVNCVVMWCDAGRQRKRNSEFVRTGDCERDNNNGSNWNRVSELSCGRCKWWPCRKRYSTDRSTSTNEI